ncbi:MAG: type II toxin-antitoxin system Y4mF family antitoxin [Candidatus Omnitrophota bacterium]
MYNQKIQKSIKQLRKAAKLTQVELAKRAGVGLRFLRELEQGKQTLRIDKINQVLEFFGYHIEAIKNEKQP